MKYMIPLGPTFRGVGRLEGRRQSAVQFVNVRIQARRFQTAGQSDLDAFSDGLFMADRLRRFRRPAGPWLGVAAHLLGDGDRVQGPATQRSRRINTADMAVALQRAGERSASPLRRRLP